MKNRSVLAWIGPVTLLFWAAFVHLILPPAHAVTLTLIWDANDPAPDSYRVFQRADGQPYDYTSPAWPTDGNNHTETACNIEGLNEGVTYYFVVRAYVGLDVSEDSNEVRFQAPIAVISETDAAVEPVITEATDSETDDGGSTDDGIEQPSPPSPSYSESDTVTEPDITEEYTEATDSGGSTDDGIEQPSPPSPSYSESDAVTEPDITEGLTEASDSETDGGGSADDGIEQPLPPSPSYEADVLPALEIFDNSYSHLGWLSIQWNESVALDGESRIAMGDIDGDGKDEVVIGLGRTHDSSIPGGLFQIIDDDYSLIGWGQIDWADYNSDNGESYPSCGDIDGDGDDEILIGLGEGGQGMVEVLDFRNGSVVHLDWITVNWPEYNTLFGKTYPAAGDIDNDGKDEIIIGLGADQSDPQVPAGLFQVFDDDFMMLSWGKIDWPEYNESNGTSYPAVGDINGDGKEVIFVGLGSEGGGRVETFQFDAGVVKHSGWITIDWEDYNRTNGQTRPAFGDVDGDGRDEILVGLGSTNSSDADIPGGRFPILDDDATLITWAQIQWPEYNAANGESYPAGGDINGDGIDEIFVGLGIQKALAAEEEQIALSSAPSSTVDGEGAGSGGCFISVGLFGRD